MRTRTAKITLPGIVCGVTLALFAILYKTKHSSTADQFLPIPLPIPPESQIIDQCFWNIPCAKAFITDRSPQNIISYYKTVFQPPDWQECEGSCVIIGCIFEDRIGFYQPGTINKVAIIIEGSMTTGTYHVSMFTPQFSADGSEFFPETYLDCE